MDMVKSKNHSKTEINIQNRLKTQDWLNGVNIDWLNGVNIAKFRTKSSKNITVYPQEAFLQFLINSTSNRGGHRRRKLSCGVFSNLLATSY
jgi:hypothetical protein